MSVYPKRKTKIRTRRSRFIIVHEGKETEKEYVLHIKTILGIERKCHIETHHAKHTSIESMIEKMTQLQDSPEQDDQLWIILDRDEENRVSEQFRALRRWEQARENNRVALSNPRFEYWLLLHVMPYPSAHMSREDSYVVEKIPGYTKNLSRCKQVFSLDAIRKAVARAAQQGYPTCQDIEKAGSGMGELVQLFMAVN